MTNYQRKQTQWRPEKIWRICTYLLNKTGYNNLDIWRLQAKQQSSFISTRFQSVKFSTWRREATVWLNNEWRNDKKKNIKNG